MSSLSVVKKSISGSALKALITSPSTKTTDTVLLFDNMFGATSGDTVYIHATAISPVVNMVNNAFITLFPASRFPAVAVLNDPGFYSVQTEAWITNGTVYTSITMQDPGQHISDLPDSVTFDFYFIGGILSNTPGTSYEKLLGAANGIATLDSSGRLPLAANTLKSWNSSPGRSLVTSNTNGTAYQVSSTRDALVTYSIDINTTLSLTSGAQGTVYLRYADDSAFTTNITEVARFVNGNTGTLTIGLNLTQNTTGTLTGMIPAGKYVKLVTENNTGTPTFTYRSGQEVLV